MTSLELVSKESHQVQIIMPEVMLMYFLAIQKKKSHLVRKKVPSQNQELKKEKLQGRMLIQVMPITTSTKLSFLDIVTIVKTLVIKKHCKAHKNEAPRLKDQTNKLRDPKEKG